jgi:hypothetical protein
VTSFLWGLCGGFVAWIVTTIVAQPLYRFLALRGEAARLLALYEFRFDPDFDPGSGGLGGPSEAWLRDRMRDYAACGAELTGFSYSQSTFTRALHRLPLKAWKCYPRSAGSGFDSLSQLNPGTVAAGETRDRIMSALKLMYRP